MSAVVECYIVSSLSHDIVLGFYWLRTCNPHINWWASITSVKLPGGHYLLAGLPCNSIAHVEFAFLDSICKKVDCGAIAWLILICLVESPDAIGACGTLAGGEFGDA